MYINQAKNIEVSIANSISKENRNLLAKAISEYKNAHTKKVNITKMWKKFKALGDNSKISIPSAVVDHENMLLTDPEKILWLQNCISESTNHKTFLP